MSTKFSLLKCPRNVDPTYRTDWEFVYQNAESDAGFLEHIAASQEPVVWRFLYEPDNGAILAFEIGEFDIIHVKNVRNAKIAEGVAALNSAMRLLER